MLLALKGYGMHGSIETVSVATFWTSEQHYVPLCSLVGAGDGRPLNYHIEIHLSVHSCIYACMHPCIHSYIHTCIDTYVFLLLLFQNFTLGRIVDFEKILHEPLYSGNI